MQLTTVLALIALLGPLATWGATELKSRWIDIPTAVASAKSEERVACSGRMTEMQTKLNNDAAEKVRAAEEAARTLAATPAEAAELADLCNRSASCRDRKKETQK